MDWTASDLCDPLRYMTSAFLGGLDRARFRRVCRSWRMWCAPLPKGIEASWHDRKFRALYTTREPGLPRDVRGDWRELALEADAIALCHVSLDRRDYPNLQRLSITFPCPQTPISGSARRLHSLTIDTAGGTRQVPSLNMSLAKLFSGCDMPSLRHVSVLDLGNGRLCDTGYLLDLLCTKCPNLTSLLLPREAGGYSIELGRIASGLRGLTNLRRLSLSMEVSAAPKLGRVLKECTRLVSLALRVFSPAEPVTLGERSLDVQPIVLPTIEALCLSGRARFPFELRSLFDSLKIPNVTRLACDVAMEWSGLPEPVADASFHPPCFKDVAWMANLTRLEMDTTKLAMLKSELPSLRLPKLRVFEAQFPRVFGAEKCIDLFVWLIIASPSLVLVNLRLISNWKMEHLQRIRDAWSEPEARSVIIGDAPEDLSFHKVANPRALLRMFTFDNGRDFLERARVRGRAPGARIAIV